MSEKKLSELTQEQLEAAIKAGDKIIDDRPLDPDFKNVDLEEGNGGN